MRRSEATHEKSGKLVTECDTVSWIHIVGITVVMSNLVVVGMAHSKRELGFDVAQRAFNNGTVGAGGYRIHYLMY